MIPIIILGIPGTEALIGVLAMIVLIDVCAWCGLIFYGYSRIATSVGTKKTCGNCHRELSSFTKTGDVCPYCGVKISSEFVSYK